MIRHRLTHFVNHAENSRFKCLTPTKHKHWFCIINMISNISKRNLKKDRRVLGKNWYTTYGGYFSDPKNIRGFIDAIIPYLPGRPLNILYVASASGLLGEKLIERLGAGTLTLIDISKQHLDENKNPETEKIYADLLKVNLKRRFDLVLMRSSLDYFPSHDLQVMALSKIRQHLLPGGLFINQPAFLEDTHERDIASEIYTKTRKIGDRYFQSSDLSDLYQQAGFIHFEKIGEGNPLVLTEQDHKSRYGISPSTIERIRRIIPSGAKSMRVTASGYELTFRFPIFLAS